MSKPPSFEGMVRVPGGAFTMGSNCHYPEERPERRVDVEAFWIDSHPVTRAGFARFVQATGHVTLAERVPSRSDYPDAPGSALVPGSAVFVQTAAPANLRRPSWWQWRAGVTWRDSAHDDAPVVHVGWDDALAYAAWAGKALPSETQWEYAARAASQTEYPWGDELMPGGVRQAHIWQGEFPSFWSGIGNPGPARVGSYPANVFGVHDMIGNVWEWTADEYADARTHAAPCCGGELSADLKPRVIKGGSYLCAPNYCARYRPAARLGQPAASTTAHIGFRCMRAG